MKKRRTKGEPVGSECRRLGNGRYSVSGQAGRPEPLYRSRLSVPPHLYPLCPLSIDVVAIIIIRFSYHWSLLLYSQKRRRLIGSRLWHVFFNIVLLRVRRPAVDRSYAQHRVLCIPEPDRTRCSRPLVPSSSANLTDLAVSTSYVIQCYIFVYNIDFSFMIFDVLPRSVFSLGRVVCRDENCSVICQQYDLSKSIPVFFLSWIFRTNNVIFSYALSILIVVHMSWTHFEWLFSNNK